MSRTPVHQAGERFHKGNQDYRPLLLKQYRLQTHTSRICQKVFSPRCYPLASGLDYMQFDSLYLQVPPAFYYQACCSYNPDGSFVCYRRVPSDNAAKSSSLEAPLFCFCAKTSWASTSLGRVPVSPSIVQSIPSFTRPLLKPSQDASLSCSASPVEPIMLFAGQEGKCLSFVDWPCIETISTVGRRKLK